MNRKLYAVPLLVSLFFLSLQAEALIDEQAGSLYSEGTLIQNLKKTYRNCVLEKGKAILQVSNFDTAVRYAPIACKRDFLRLEQNFISNTLMPDASRELLKAYEVGIEIDLVNHLISVQQN